MKLSFKRKGNLQNGPSQAVNGNALGKTVREFQDKALLDKFDALFRSQKDIVVWEALESAKQLPQQEKALFYEKFFETPTVLDEHIYKSQFPQEYWPLAVKKKLEATSGYGPSRLLFAEAKRILKDEECDSSLLRLAVREKFKGARELSTFFLEDTNFSKTCAWVSGTLALAASAYAGATKKLDLTTAALIGTFGTAAAGVVGFITGEVLCRIGNFAARPLLFIDAVAYAISASVAFHSNKKAKSTEVRQVHAEKMKRPFTARVKDVWDNNIKAISRIAGIGISTAAILLFDSFILGGKDLAIEGWKMLASGNVELLGLIVGLPATVCIEGLVLYVGYCIGRSLDPDHQITEPFC